MRKLIAMVVAAMAMAGVLASQASAAVEVRNSSGELCGVEAVCEVSVGTGPASTVDLVWTGGGPNQGRYNACTADFTFQVVSETGEILLVDADFEPQSLWWECRSAPSGIEVNDCGDAGWAGQIESVGGGDFEAVFDSCWVSMFDNWGPGIAGQTRFGIEEVTAPPPYEHLSYQRWTLDAQHPLAGSSNVTLTGDLAPPSEELQITEVE